MIFLFGIVIFIILYLIWNFWEYGVYVYFSFLIFIVIYLLWSFISARKMLKDENELAKEISPEAIKLLKKHALFFLFPITCRQISGLISFVQISGIIFGIIFLIRAKYIFSVLSFLQYSLGFLAFKLNPVHYINDAFIKNPAKWANEKKILDEIIAYHKKQADIPMRHIGKNKEVR